MDLLQVLPQILLYTLKPRYNEPRNSEFFDIVNKTQLPFEDLLSISYLMKWIIQYSKQKVSDRLARYIKVW